MVELPACGRHWRQLTAQRLLYLLFSKEQIMVIVERLVQVIAADKWAELEELDKKYAAVEGRLGYPAKRRLMAQTSPHVSGTVIIERQWNSMAEMEAAYDQAMADAEWQALLSAGAGVVVSNQMELYTVMD